MMMHADLETQRKFTHPIGRHHFVDVFPAQHLTAPRTFIHPLCDRPSAGGAGIIHLIPGTARLNDSMSQEEYRKAAIDAVKKLSQDVGIPADLKEIVKKEDIAFLAWLSNGTYPIIPMPLL